LVSINNSEQLDYDIFGRLVRKRDANGYAVDIDYDYMGNRIRKNITKNGVSSEIFYFDDLYELRSDGSEVRSVKSPFGIVAEDIVMKDGSKSQLFLHTDHLGNARLITDSDGKIISKQDYTAFGSNESSTAENDRYFVGRKFDKDLNYYLLGSRLYDPTIGRFVTPDMFVLENPEQFITSPQSLNLYSYACNNPITYRDPSGYFVEVAAIAGFAIGAVLAGAAASESGAGTSTIIGSAFIGGALGLLSAQEWE
jgi:RHS repeat-associated protein